MFRPATTACEGVIAFLSVSDIVIDTRALPNLGGYSSQLHMRHSKITEASESALF